LFAVEITILTTSLPILKTKEDTALDERADAKRFVAYDPKKGCTIKSWPMKTFTGSKF